MATIDFDGGTFHLGRRYGILTSLVQGTRQALPIYRMIDYDGTLFDPTELFTWTAQISSANGPWRGVDGALTGLGGGLVRWEVADGDDLSLTPLINPIPAHLQLRGELNDKPLYTSIGAFLLCPGSFDGGA